MTRNLTPGDGLTGKQRKAVAALPATGEVAAAAGDAGISRETLHRWLRDPVFREAVRAAESDALNDLSRSLVTLGRAATGTLSAAMADDTAPWTTRVRAADAVLGRLLQLRELATLEARVAELERAAGIDEGRR